MPCPYPARSAQAVPQTRVTPVGVIKSLHMMSGVLGPPPPKSPTRGGGAPSASGPSSGTHKLQSAGMGCRERYG
ncbi:unnamed protein product [Symbiodinium natans]|uniref:Uncharacterized protein n=1 Tax=Symbiodinium natans TaxID=878477 RepID=A0A812QZZ9_9DINO|nr:unnamed protein product [Symbiodinium natans]